MSKWRRFTARLVLDEIFADEDSHFDPDIVDSQSEISETETVSSGNATDRFTEPVPSTSTAECDNNRPARRGRRRGRNLDSDFVYSPANDLSSASESDSEIVSANDTCVQQQQVSVAARGRRSVRGRRGRGRGNSNNNNRQAVACGAGVPEDDVWLQQDREPELVNFTGNPGLMIDIEQDSSPLDYFSLFIGEEEMQMFVDQTNLYADQCVQSRPDASPNSVFKLWKPVTLQEMKVFLALTVNMGLIWKPEVRQYWSTDIISETPFWGSYMARDRYLAILGFFHITDNEAERDRTDKIWKVRPLFDHLSARFKEVYYPRQELSVDESMVPWRGRLSFQMFIPSKPTRYGIKMYCCCEADTGFVCRLQIYTGAGPGGPEKNHGENVVRRLMQDFLSKGHTVYMDSFFSSVALFEYLRDNDTMAVGTIVAGRVGVTRSLHPKELKLKKGEFWFRRKENLLCLRLHDRKNVILLSTRHTAESAIAPQETTTPTRTTTEYDETKGRQST